MACLKWASCVWKRFKQRDLFRSIMREEHQKCWIRSWNRPFLPWYSGSLLSWQPAGFYNVVSLWLTHLFLQQVFANHLPKSRLMPPQDLGISHGCPSLVHWEQSFLLWNSSEMVPKSPLSVSFKTTITSCRIESSRRKQIIELLTINYMNILQGHTLILLNIFFHEGQEEYGFVGQCLPLPNLS